MKLSPRLVLAALALPLFGCATTPPKETRPAYVYQLPKMGVSPGTYSRIYNHRVLTFADILDLVTHNVPDDKIVAYLRGTHAPYQFTVKQINQLAAAGAGSTLVNYLGQGAGAYLIDASDSAAQQQLRQQAMDEKYWRHAYFTDPYYYGAAPFNYGWPGEWGPMMPLY
ncbi:MAG TPA: hypothetical protein VIS74_06735 [Chthoniobacterales bacterium]